MKSTLFLMTSLTFFAVSAASAAPDPIPVRIGAAGNSYPYNYACDAESKPNANGTQVCGIEVELFNRICADMNLQCTWVLHAWAAAPGKDPFRDPGGFLFDLINPAQGTDADADSSYPYDVAISSLGASPARRLEMLFTISYYWPKDALIGDVLHPVVKRKDFDKNGFPLDKPYFRDRKRKLNIANLPGDLYLHLTEAYPNPKHIEIFATTTYDQDLVLGKVDLAMAWSGIERKIRDITNGGGNLKFGIVSNLSSVVKDPLNGVVVASRISKSGRRLNELFNQGIIKSRMSGGGGGYHRQIFMKALNADLWPCQANPYVHGDPKCKNIPY